MTAGTSSRSASPVKTRRGDLAVITSASRSAFVQGEAQESVRVTLGRVSGVSREGKVLRYKEATFADGEEREVKVGARERVQTVSAALVDIEAVLADYRAHTWRATSGSDSDMIRPYSSLEDLRKVIRGHRYPQSQ